MITRQGSAVKGTALSRPFASTQAGTTTCRCARHASAKGLPSALLRAQHGTPSRTVPRCATLRRRSPQGEAPRFAGGWGGTSDYCHFPFRIWQQKSNSRPSPNMEMKSTRKKPGRGMAHLEECQSQRGDLLLLLVNLLSGVRLQLGMDGVQLHGKFLITSPNPAFSKAFTVLERTCGFRSAARHASNKRPGVLPSLSAFELASAAPLENARPAQHVPVPMLQKMPVPPQDHRSQTVPRHLATLTPGN